MVVARAAVEGQGVTEAAVERAAEEEEAVREEEGIACTCSRVTTKIEIHNAQIPRSQSCSCSAGRWWTMQWYVVTHTHQTSHHHRCTL